MLFLLGFLPWLLQANTVATTENDPNAFVSHVNVITGDLYLKEQDVAVQGLEPIVLTRTYISQKGKGAWSLFSPLIAYADTKAKILEIPEASGTKLFYRWETPSKKSGRLFSPFNLQQDGKGLSNTSKGKLSGKTNLKNQKIQASSDLSSFFVIAPDGAKRHYRSKDRFEIDALIEQNPSDLISFDECYLLVKEELPNGHHIHYDWPESKRAPWRIKSCSGDHAHTFAWVQFSPPEERKGRHSADCSVQTSDGRSLEYFFFPHENLHQLKRVESNEAPETSYHYTMLDRRKFLTLIKVADRPFLKISYYLPEQDGIDQKDPVCFRVKAVSAPFLVDGEEKYITLHKFIYDVGNKKTTVFDAYGVPTLYHWDEDLRLVRLDFFSKPELFHHRVKFIWGEGNDASNLLCKVLFDEHKEPLSATCYTYDPFGNVKKEEFFGNLSGEGPPLLLNGMGFPRPGGECYTKTYRYSQDGKNLLLSQKEHSLVSSGPLIEYEYREDVPLLLKESIYDPQTSALIQQKRYEYKGVILSKEIVSCEEAWGGTHLITS